MAWTEADYLKLKKAIAQGATRVRFDDQEVTYRSLAEMRDLAREMRAEIDKEAGIEPKRRPRAYCFVTGKGLSR